MNLVVSFQVNTLRVFLQWINIKSLDLFLTNRDTCSIHTIEPLNLLFSALGYGVRNDVINMSRAWDKQKNLSPRKELNLWPSVTPAMIFLRPADLKENRVCEKAPARV